MEFDAFIETFPGGIEALAKELSVEKQTIYRYRNRSRTPDKTGMANLIELGFDVRWFFISSSSNPSITEGSS